jgi:hypothetical protein
LPEWILKILVNKQVTQVNCNRTIFCFTRVQNNIYMKKTMDRN